MAHIMSHALVLAAIADLSGRPQRQIGLDQLLQGDLGLSDDYLRQLINRLGQSPDTAIPLESLAKLQRMTVGELIAAVGQ
jgi:hypothetical protein